MRGHSCIPSILVLAVLAAAGCGDEEGFADARPIDAMIPTGTFSLSWTITDSVTGDPIDCDDANATSVSVTVREVNAGQGEVESFTCANLSGTSGGFLPGTYMLGFELRGPDGQIATAASVTGVEINSNQDTPVTPAIGFEVQANGQFAVRLVAAPLTSNCDTIANGGGGIDGVVLTLTKDGACVPVSYAIAAGASDPAGTYNAACPPAELNRCIEQDQDITSDLLASGSYTLEAVGNIGNDACWVGERQFRVPTGGATAPVTTVGMAYQDALPGCPPLM